MTTITYRVIDPLQAQLTAMRPRQGHVALMYRKPGGRWQRRSVPSRRLEATVLKLEDQGAEICVGSPQSRDMAADC